MSFLSLRGLVSIAYNLGGWYSSSPRTTALRQTLLDPEALQTAGSTAGSNLSSQQEHALLLAGTQPGNGRSPSDDEAAPGPGPEPPTDNNAAAGLRVRPQPADAPGSPSLEASDPAAASQTTISCHIPVSCDDPTSLFFLVIADAPTAVITLLTSLTVWLFIGLFTWWLRVKVDDAVLYDDPPLELALLLIVLFLQAVPPFLENVLAPFREAAKLRRFAARVRPGFLRRRMRCALVFLVADRLQPALLIFFSVYCALFLSGGDLLNALQNVMVLSFIASLDTELQQKFLRWRFGDGSRVWIVFRRVRYAGGAAGEAAFWAASKSNREEVVHGLRAEESGGAEKWQLMTRADCGLGIGDEAPEQQKMKPGRPAAAEGSAAREPGVAAPGVVESVNLVVSIFSWDQVNRAVFRDGRGRPCIDFGRVDRQRMEWYLEGASDAQWAYELNSDTRVALLLECPQLVSRFSLTAHDGYLRGLSLTAEHAEVLSEMLPRSPIAWLDLSENPDVGDHGAAALAEALRHVSLAGLGLAQLGLTDAGAHALLDALAANPRAVRGEWLVLEGNAVSGELLEKLWGLAGSSTAPATVRNRPPPPWWRWPRRRAAN